MSTFLWPVQVVSYTIYATGSSHSSLLQNDSCKPSNYKQYKQANLQRLVRFKQIMMNFYLVSKISYTSNSTFS